MIKHFLQAVEWEMIPGLNPQERLHAWEGMYKLLSDTGIALHNGRYFFGLGCRGIFPLDKHWVHSLYEDVW